MLTQSLRLHIKKLAEYSADEYDIWFVDEVIFQQQGSKCCMWIPPEVKQPVVMQEPGRKSAGYFGAVRLRDGKFIFFREETVFNADSTWNFLKKTSPDCLWRGRRRNQQRQISSCESSQEVA